ncbi:uncharacterized protein LOC134259610 [Saccostrea cucullata]|uniref:uncharacterized protein LOC134259610 n=1 Tax=Saccostrea cuccullata TaxID=36930 RepID=UPI002ED14D62
MSLGKDGFLCFVFHVVTSDHFHRSCPQKTLSNSSQIQGVSISEREVIESLESKSNKFIDAAKQLKEQYIPPTGRRITNTHLIDRLSEVEIDILPTTNFSKMSNFISKEQTEFLNETWIDLSVVSDCLELVRKEEEALSFGELSHYTNMTTNALCAMRFDLHTALHSLEIGMGNHASYNANSSRVCRSFVNRQDRYFRDFVIVNQSLKYMERLRNYLAQMAED